MKRFHRLLALGFALTMLAACSPKAAESTPTPEPTPVETTEPAPEPLSMNVSMLKGTTGLGAAKMMVEYTEESPYLWEGESGSAAVPTTFHFTLMGEATEAAAALTKGEVDIAAVPTNLASNLYHKTNGGVQLLCLNTLGVLYILENGESIQSMADLKGKTIHAFGQGANPEFVLAYLLEKNGMKLGQDVNVEWYTSTDEVSTRIASGDVELAMLPVPAATAAQVQSQGKVRFALDLNEEWENSGAQGLFTMGCVVVRTQFAQEHPDAVAAFLSAYADSIGFMSDPANLDDAAGYAEQAGIIPKAAIAKKALPDANLCCITGNDMMDGIQGYYQVLFAADPTSIGGSIPDGAFYYSYNS